MEWNETNANGPELRSRSLIPVPFRTRSVRGCAQVVHGSPVGPVMTLTFGGTVPMGKLQTHS